jgi:hypothetical protein
MMLKSIMNPSGKHREAKKAKPHIREPKPHVRKVIHIFLVF